MRKLSFVCSAIVFLCFRQALGRPASLPSLMRDIQFGNLSTWIQFDASPQLTRWTDGRDVRAAACRVGHEPHSGALQKNGECCSISDYIVVDPNVGYKFSIYVKSTGFDTKNSFGFFVYNTNKERIIHDNLNDPYFKKDTRDINMWEKWTGYILPHYIPDNDNDNQADSQSEHTNGVDWKWPPEASYVALRFGSCSVSKDATPQSNTTPPTSTPLVADFLPDDESGDDESGDDERGDERNEHSGNLEEHLVESEIVQPNEHGVDRAEQTANKTMYSFPRVQQIEAKLDENVRRVVTYDLTKSEEWESKPQYVGKLSVNAQHTPIARIVETDDPTSCYYPWGITHIFRIDSRKTYEFSVWISSTEKDLHNFLGFRAYDKDYNLLDLSLDESEATLHFKNVIVHFANVTNRPYFKRSNDDTTAWTRWHGFVVPNRTDVNNDISLHYSKGRNWIWPRGSVYAQLRFGTCYGNGDRKGIAYFALPQVTESEIIRNS